MPLSRLTQTFPLALAAAISESETVPIDRAEDFFAELEDEVVDVSAELPLFAGAASSWAFFDFFFFFVVLLELL